jgi:DNA-binding response OmpR family regulator
MRVLVAEDEPTIRDLLTRGLRENAYVESEVSRALLQRRDEQMFVQPVRYGAAGVSSIDPTRSTSSPGR